MESENLDGTAGDEFSSGANSTIDQTEAAAKKMVLAGIGAVAAMCDAGEETFDRLVDRGEHVREEWERRTGELREENRGTRKRVRHYVRNLMSTVLDTVDLPSKTDLAAIQLKLNMVNRKLDDLQMQAESASATSAKRAVSKKPGETST